MSASRRGIWPYRAALLLLSAYALNVLIGKANAVLGWQLPHAGDVAEFAVVLAAMVSFVIGLLGNEKSPVTPTQHKLP